jgi:hypothetical protein
MVPKTQTIFDDTVSIATDGTWFALPSGEPASGRQYYTALFSIKSGTGTFKLEGRNTPDDTAFSITGDLTTSQGVVFAHVTQVRVVVVSGVALELVASLNVPVRSVD